jgi:hypothetical protein
MSKRVHRRTSHVTVEGRAILGVVNVELAKSEIYIGEDGFTAKDYDVSD